MAEKNAVCPDCQVGELLGRRSTYVGWADGRFITVPDFPSWVCDVCGWREYDRTALSELQTLLNLNQSQQERLRRSKAGGDKDRPAAGRFLPRRRP